MLDDVSALDTKHVCLSPPQGGLSGLAAGDGEAGRSEVAFGDDQVDDFGPVVAGRLSR